MLINQFTLSLSLPTYQYDKLLDCYQGNTFKKSPKFINYLPK